MSYWLVAVPRSCSPRQDPLPELQARLGTVAHVSVRDWPATALPVGTLDRLMALSDTAARADALCHAVQARIGKQYRDVLADHAQQSDAATLTADLRVDQVTPGEYVRAFAWDQSRYPLGAQALGALCDQFEAVGDQYGAQLKVQTAQYLDAKHNLVAWQRKMSGSLLVRPLHAILLPEHVVAGEYLDTAIAVVPRARRDEWLAEYETLEDRYVAADQDDATAAADPNPFATHRAQCRSVVPGSCLEVFADNEFVVYRVVLIRKFADRFRATARKNRYTIRDVESPAERAAEQAQAAAVLERALGVQWRTLVKWCLSAYSEVVKAWIHVKMVRLFVESVLRFGLPISFMSALVEFAPSLSPSALAAAQARARAVLAQLYAPLAPAALTTPPRAANDVDFSGIADEFFPYVFVDVSFA